ncbi:hypothetical protein R3P38DRAFT_2777165 [Favolaschia claudopus]|uniref:Uncharacterized protein n=1 Tax=Favolaschia claudopus TaxID=2862362 RepID=A0AAW0BKT5_9AGAR
MSKTLRDHNPRTSSSVPFPPSPCSNTVPFPLLHGAVPPEGSENLPPPRVRVQRVETQHRSQPPTPLEAFHTALQHVRTMSIRAQLSTAPSHEKHAVIDPPYQDKPNIAVLLLHRHARGRQLGAGKASPPQRATYFAMPPSPLRTSLSSEGELDGSSNIATGLKRG